MRITVTSIALCLFFLAGCGPADPSAQPPLAPGTWRMISVEHAGNESGRELLPQGRFEDWHAGLPAPAGFHAPAEVSDSTMIRGVKAGYLGATGYTARQTWRGPGSDAGAEDGFGVRVNLAPDTQYRLEVIASVTAGLVAAIQAIEDGGGGQHRTLARSVVEVRGESPARFEGTFTTQAGGPVLLSSYALAGSTFPGTAIWSAWRLEESSKPIESANVADASHRRALVDQALDQIRTQTALYGGVEAWAEATAPNRKNATRILREEGAKGDSILGYEHFVSTREELDWFERYSAPCLPDVFGSAGAAIRRAERALNARGIQLVVVPMPERIQLSFDAVNRPSAELPVNLAAHAALVERMLAEDVLVLDPAPMLWAMKSGGISIFWNGDGDLPSTTIQALAEWCAPRLVEMGLVAPDELRQTYTVNVDEIPLEQRFIGGLPGEYRTSIPEAVHAVQSVRDAQGGLFQPVPASPVLAAGSLAIQHHLRGASFAAHLSRALGFPVALPAKHLPDTEIPAWLAEGKAPELAATRFVVFCVPERALVLDGWK